jgi:hypothetical protein
MRKLAAWAGLGALFFAVRLAWNLIGAEPIPEPAQDDFAAMAAEIDAAVAEDLATGKGALARGWLEQDDNMLFEGDPEGVESLIESFYEAGATGVWFTGIEEFEGRNLTASIAVELPVEKEARARVFGVEAGYWGEHGEPTPDVGQRYLEVGFD